MIPQKTQYFLATKPSDYKRMHAFLREQHLKESLEFPTVWAERDGQVIGLLSTNTKDSFIQAGPLWVSPDGGKVTVMRLIEVYEEQMRAMGITSYLFYISHEHGAWKHIMDKFMTLHPETVQVVQETDTFTWYKRSI